MITGEKRRGWRRRRRKRYSALKGVRSEMARARLKVPRARPERIVGVGIEVVLAVGRVRLDRRAPMRCVQRDAPFHVGAEGNARDASRAHAARAMAIPVRIGALPSVSAARSQLQLLNARWVFPVVRGRHVVAVVRARRIRLRLHEWDEQQSRHAVHRHGERGTTTAGGRQV